MPKKIGDGGYGLEEYDRIDGKYSADGKPNNNGKLSQADKDLLFNGLELDEDDIFNDEELLDVMRKYDLLDFELENIDYSKKDNESKNIFQENENFSSKPITYTRHDGETYEIPYDNINKLRENGTLKYYEIKEIDLQKFVEEKGLNNPSHGVFGRRPEIWGKRDEYHYDESKNDEGPIRLNSDMSVHDGNHRLFALYNDGYSKAQVLVKKNNDYLKREVNNGTKIANFDSKRINDIIEDSTTNNINSDYARAYFATIDPMDFIKLTTTNEANYSLIKNFKNGQDMFDENTFDPKKISQTSRDTPTLQINMKTGDIMFHEGRHRMAGFLRNGYKEVPIKVMVSEGDKDNSSPKDEFEVNGQKWSDGASAHVAKIKNLIPANLKYKDLVLQQYGNAKDINY